MYVCAWQTENCFSFYLSPVNEYWKLYGYSNSIPLFYHSSKQLQRWCMYMLPYSDLNSLWPMEPSITVCSLFSFFQIKDYWFISLYEMNTLRRYVLLCLVVISRHLPTLLDHYGTWQALPIHCDSGIKLFCFSFSPFVFG